MNYFCMQTVVADTFSKFKVNNLMLATVNGNVVLTWEQVKKADGYAIFEKEENGSYRLLCYTHKTKKVLTNKKSGKTYCYYVRPFQKKESKTIYGKVSKKVSVFIPEKGVSSVKNFLQVAIAPVGTTMYVWGGGWNQKDTAAGKAAKRTGLSPKWKTFYQKHKKGYDYRKYRYQIHDGLDCSGYVGWCVYNVLHTKNNEKGYVASASKQAKKFANMKFGSYRQPKEVKDYKAGDIMSSNCSCCGHVWIVIGQCKDGSVVLVHASPPGVQMNGTTTPDGKKNSQAYRLAKRYMKKYYPFWYASYSNVSRNAVYLSHYSQMRWNTTQKSPVLSDPQNYQNMSADKILKDLFKKIK